MQPGDTVPDFTATTDTGEQVTLSQLTAEGPVVLFFYPKAHTGGCTAEVCHFRDLDAAFERLGATRVGVSRDDVATQRDFSAKHDLRYPLLADEDGSIGAIFGAKRIGPLWHKRLTAVVDEDRRLLASFTSETDMEVHADRALDVLAQRDGSAAA